MARLTQQQVQALIKAPKNRDNLDFATLQEEWLKLHCEPLLQKSKLPPRAYLQYTTWIKSLVTSDKTARILSLLNTPFESVAITGKIFAQLGKFFDTQDRYIKTEFRDTELQADFTQYLEHIKDAEFWPSKGMDALRIGINSILVCDMPAMQEPGERPEPYYYLLDLRNVVDIDINCHSGNIEYIIFKKDDTTIIEIDDEYYRIYDLKNVKKTRQPNGQVTIEEVPYIGHLAGDYGAPVDAIDMSNLETVTPTEVQHSTYSITGGFVSGIGYCPAIDFYGLAISGTGRLDKRGPVTDVITKLNYYLFFNTLSKYYFSYGPFPIICTFRIKDKNFDDKNIETTDTGAQALSLNQYSAYDLIAVDTIDPRKQPRNLIGPGTTMEGNAPEHADDFNMFADGGPIKVVEMNADNLEWVRGYVAYLGEDIVEICTGRRPQVNNAAKNEDQVGESLDQAKSILDTIGAQFERAHKFVLKTLAIQRYGIENFISVTVDYGSDYFLKDAETLTNEYSAAIKAGMSYGYIHSLRLAVITTRFKNNPDELLRQRILLDVEPYIGLTWQEMKVAGLDVSDWINYVVKLNFITFISRFENEFTNITTFMSKVDYKLKISFIIKALQKYGSELQQPAAESAGTITDTI